MAQNTTFKTRGGQGYESPSAEVIDVVSEGVFCTSGYDTPNNGYGDNSMNGI